MAVTIRFLTSEISLQALAAGYKLGSAFVSCIVREVCHALRIEPRDEFVAFPEGEHWEVIRRDFLGAVGDRDGKHIRVAVAVSAVFISTKVSLVSS